MPYVFGEMMDIDSTVKLVYGHGQYIPRYIQDQKKGGNLSYLNKPLRQISIYAENLS